MFQTHEGSDQGRHGACHPRERGWALRGYRLAVSVTCQANSRPGPAVHCRIRPCNRDGETQSYVDRIIRDRFIAREIEVLNWLEHGKRSWDISAILGISESTVNFHVKNITQKLNTENRTQAVAVGASLGLIEID